MSPAVDAASERNNAAVAARQRPGSHMKFMTMGRALYLLIACVMLV